MKQSRIMSLVETVLSTVIGFGVALTTQILVFPLFGFSPPLSHNLLIGAIFTVVSIARGFLVRRLFEALHIRNPLSAGALAIIAERRRQIEQEGWTADHDATHRQGDLARAGACYALAGCESTIPIRVGNDIVGEIKVTAKRFWPWSQEWWKPTDHRRNLVKAGALILAELDKADAARKRKAAS
jgi:hypothetical protein